ncbi:MAG: cyclic nucleotide-binding domain-containing protein [Candidatus Mcinerneyibacterium aminivorans]|uniref:Cyclic nucleotide-binding domain-containing protein n=1 Tax=Candidatus Mcinerneyibacterium aminivorans TaxID=2703815 RepID=A0A5D0MEJ5_9BACT|nr:MAG: cyclic nucleotide-binding domain-containing protein [Candidatus Mcinerneyibacterium aminivorans]
MDLKILSDNKLFQSVNVEKLNSSGVDFNQIFKQIRFNENEVVIKQGNRANKLYLIKSGSVVIKKKVDKNKKVAVNKLYKNDFFGELGILLPRRERTAMVIADTELDLYVINRENLFFLIKKCKQIKNNMLKNIARIIENSDKKKLAEKLQEDVIFDLYENIKNNSKKKDKTTERRHRFTVKKNKKFIVIQENEVFYFSSDKNYSFIHVYDKHYFYNKSLKKVEKELDKSKFMRIHRKYIISCDKVSQINKEASRQYYVVLKDDNKTRLKVGRTFIKKLKNRFDI